MCVYAKEDPLFLAQCIESVLAQAVLPEQWVIVKDGPLTDGLEQVLSELRFPNELKVVALPENVTLGPARAEGLLAASYDWVAIMDSDDICRPDRFIKQCAMIENDPSLCLVGGQIMEFREDPGNTAKSRLVPCGHDEIVSFLKKRNPFNHVTMMLRRDLALEAGNYVYFPWFEDYDLWSRMICNGARCANHPDVLVDVRVGDDTYGRRRGLSYIRSEWRMQKQLRKLGLIGAGGFIRNIAARIPVRLLPGRILAMIYRKYARK